MGTRFLVLGILGSIGLVSTPAMADTLVKPLGKIILLDGSAVGASGQLPTIPRGEQFAVACGCLSGQGDVRVVLAIAGEPDEKPLGFKKLLVTDERMENGDLRIRVPEAPSLANHTVDVKVYVVGRRDVHSCDAGRVKVT
jgi:hypothetical protein